MTLPEAVLAGCLTRLDLFRVSRQLAVLDALLDAQPTRGTVAS